MKELELTSNSALTETVYETNFNGADLEIKLAAGSGNAENQCEMDIDINVYHVSYPSVTEEILFSQPIDGEGNKVPVYSMGKAEDKKGCIHKTVKEGEITRETARVITAYGPTWIYAAVVIGMDSEGSESPFLISQGIGSYGGDNSNENDMIGYVDGKVHNMCALIVRRAKLEGLHLSSIRVGYKYIFVEPSTVGKALVSEG